MNMKVTAEWLEEAYGRLFGFFDEQELRKLDVPCIAESEDPAKMVAYCYAHQTDEAIRSEMDHIPVDRRICIESLEAENGSAWVSRWKGALLHYEAKRQTKSFGVTEIRELWLLEDGRLAEITCVSFVRVGNFFMHRKFRKIVKNKDDVFFELDSLADAFLLLRLRNVSEHFAGEVRMRG